MFVMSFVLLVGGVVVLGLEFGWLQIEFDENNMGELVTENERSGNADSMKLLNTIDFAVDATEEDNPTSPSNAAAIALDNTETYPSRSQMQQQFSSTDEEKPDFSPPMREEPEAIKVVDYVEQTPETIENSAVVEEELPLERLHPGENVPELKGVDLKGSLHHVGDSGNVAASAVIFLSPDCSFSKKTIPQLNRMASVFRDKDIEFFGILSDLTTTRAQALEFRRISGISFPLLFDTSGELRQQLRPSHTPQVFVIDPDGTLLYTGRIDDRFVPPKERQSRIRQHHLTRVLQSVTSQKEIRVAESDPVGCEIEAPVKTLGSIPVTYTRDIAALVQTQCMSCHREGGSAPFTLSSYEEVSRRAKQFQLVTKSGYMPPWKPAVGVGRFQHTQRLSERDLEMIETWVKAGTPHGLPSELPPAPSFTADWKLGRPDLVVRIPETVTLPAKRNDIYQFFVIPSELVRNRMVTAVEFRPGNPKIIEHMVLYSDSSGKARQLDAEAPGLGYQRFGGPGFDPSAMLGRWVPGASPHRYSDTIGRRIPAQSDLVLQIHYRPSGKEEQDQPVLGIHFASKENRTPTKEILIANPKLRIPADEAEYHHTASYRLPVATTIHSISPHMRRLGRGVKVTAYLPEGNEIPLLLIDDWDFRWQNRFLLRKPLRLPQGTRLEVETVFNNSSENPYNPLPDPEAVEWGDGALNETALCFFDVTTDNPANVEPLFQHNQRFLVKQFDEKSRIESQSGVIPAGLNSGR